MRDFLAGFDGSSPPAAFALCLLAAEDEPEVDAPFSFFLQGRDQEP